MNNLQNLLKSATSRRSRSLLIVILGYTLFLGCYSQNLQTPKHGYSAERTRLIQSLYSCLGSPYRWGGIDRSGFDCSGLVCFVYKRTYNLTLPHNSKELYRISRTVTLRSAEAGDLIFFRTDQKGVVSHVGIYIGEGSFIHASSSRGVIRSELSQPYYKKRVLSVRRLPLK